ncbi:MAG: hypothetical protein ACREJT_08500 [Myxococcota bacterium]
MARSGQSPLPWLAPLITIIAIAWAIPHLAAGLDQMGRSVCWFPIQQPFACLDEGTCRFSISRPPEGDEYREFWIDRPRAPRAGAFWSSTQTGLTYTIHTLGNSDITADPVGFLRALEAWLVAQPNGESDQAIALSTVRALIATRSPMSSAGLMSTSTLIANWSGIAHNTLSVLIVCAGVASAFAWANQAAARRIAAARIASSRCASCSYDLAGLPGPICPECGTCRLCSAPDART